MLNILASAHNRDCGREMGEEIGWLISPFLNGFHDGYARRKTGGSSNPANKQNHIARWLLAMHEVTRKAAALSRPCRFLI